MNVPHFSLLNYHYYGHIPKKPCEKMYFEAGLRLPSLHQGPSLGKRRGLRETGKESCCLPTAPAFPRVGGWDFCKNKTLLLFLSHSQFQIPSKHPSHALYDLSYSCNDLVSPIYSRSCLWLPSPCFKMHVEVEDVPCPVQEVVWKLHAACRDILMSIIS